ncbi:MAG: hypothetical protein ABIQ27_01015 [Flavobacterium sp.]|uniref:hypothetical protein n=1 Tax=Flavobacterium sp. TaxID=239 RepID=UPI0032659D5B
MKKLEDFKTEEVKLGKLFTGGRVATSSSKPNGGCQDVTTDSFDDKNGNGVWDTNEWGETSTRTVC